MNQTDSLLGRSVLLAGATGGIGRALGDELQERGAMVTSIARRADALDELRVTGARLAADLRSPEACWAAVAAAMTHAGRLDVVINAVGVVSFGPVAELSVDAMEEQRSATHSKMARPTSRARHSDSTGRRPRWRVKSSGRSS